MDWINCLFRHAFAGGWTKETWWKSNDLVQMHAKLNKNTKRHFWSSLPLMFVHVRILQSIIKWDMLALINSRLIRHLVCGSEIWRNLRWTPFKLVRFASSLGCYIFIFVLCGLSWSKFQSRMHPSLKLLQTLQEKAMLLPGATETPPTRSLPWEWLWFAELIINIAATCWAYFILILQVPFHQNSAPAFMVRSR